MKESKRKEYYRDILPKDVSIEITDRLKDIGANQEEDISKVKKMLPLELSMLNLI